MTATPPVYHFDTIDSTNLEARRLVATGFPHDAWIRADHQSQGRGRGEHLWVSPKGNLHATMLLSPDCDAKDVVQLSLVAALAVYDVIATVVDRQGVKLKWPNDCHVNGAKVSGILVETCQNDPLRVAIGCGINVATGPSGLPYPTTSLRAHRLDIAVDEVFRVLVASMRLRILQWDAGHQFGAIREAWLDRCYPRGSPLRVRSDGLYISGSFAGLTEDGALLLADDQGELRRIYAGDVMMTDAA